MTGDREAAAGSWAERLPLAPARRWLAPAITLATVLVALLLRLLLLGIAPTGLAFITFFPAVLLTAFLFGARMGVLAAAASIALAAVFLVSDPLRPGFVVEVLPAIVPFLVLVSFNLWLFHTMQRTNAKLRLERARSAALAETRETLFHELQHRVSNNLQVAAGLLALQKRHVTDEAAQVAVDEAARRLAVIGRVSRQLYASDRAPRAMRDFLEPLCTDVIEMTGRSDVTVTVEADDGLLLDSDAAVPIALIVAETVANAIEHGLAGREGTIDVALTRHGRGVRLEVRDDGCGLPDGFDLATSGSLGLGIVRTFADQLGGSFQMLSGERTTARLTLPG